MPLNLFWGDNLELLAERMCRQGRERTDSFKEVAVVVGSPIPAARPGANPGCSSTIV